MNLEIITIGDEILIGQIVDTNSAWMAQQLNNIGIEVGQIVSVADAGEAITKALSDAKERGVQVVICTGGLGPTKDDVTKQTLASYFQSDLYRDDRVLAHVTQFFERLKRPMLESNKRQADVLRKAEVLFNAVGTAPGMLVRDDPTYYFFLPGVPMEMMYLMTNEVLPMLAHLPGIRPIIHQTILTAGIGESFLAEKLRPLEDRLPSHIHLAYLPKYGQVRLRLTAKGEDEIKLRDEMEIYQKQLQALVQPYVVGEGDATLEEHIIRLLDENKLMLSTAESCTGGYVAHLITKIAGSSSVYRGGVVSYSNELKMDVLGVPSEVLDQYGAVSQETVVAMATGAKQRFATDYAVATTGIAGPGGGTEEKPVGTVWIGIAGKQKVVTKKLQLSKVRETNIERASAQAMLHLYLLLKEEIDPSMPATKQH
ncbi:competence/damage-inducible protein A [Olivibacter sitiensis]|uniref:competence/damage-inducible protein A n=1 Tax=Olivibacter sitiensis TaxID=376470 RepID=UPI0004095C79|nr:competence/damage-inducible protein A [Olivibacter sitiensis]